MTFMTWLHTKPVSGNEKPFNPRGKPEPVGHGHRNRSTRSQFEAYQPNPEQFQDLIHTETMNSSLELPHQFQRHNSSESAISTPLFISYIVCVVLNAPAAVFASVGNALILAALRKTSSLHAASKALLSNLAFTDLCVGLIIQPLFVAMLLFEINLGTVAVSRFLFYCFAYPPSAVSFFTVTVVSVDRLLALYFWRTYREVMTLQRVVTILVVLWILGALASVTALLASYLVYMVLSSSSIFLCIAISTLSFLLIYRKLCQVKVKVSVSATQEAPQSARCNLNVEKYRKSASSMCHVCCALGLSYLPFLFLTVLLSVIDRSPGIMAAQAFCLSLILLNSSLNPVLFCWRIRDVRRGIVKTIRQIWCCSSCAERQE